LIIADVIPEGPAAAAGLQTGDIILSVDGKPLEDPSQLAGSVFRHKAGDELKVELLRGDERLQKTVAVLERPNSPGSLADLASYRKNLVRQLGVLAVTLDEKVNAILPGLRRLTGVVVAAVPAEYAGIDPGLRGGDVIYSINGQTVNKLEELRQVLDSKKTGDAIALLVEREGQLSYLAFELQ
jgi:serine protease Do